MAFLIFKSYEIYRSVITIISDTLEFTQNTGLPFRQVHILSLSKGVTPPKFEG
jgi:hypothetical protein